MVAQVSNGMQQNATRKSGLPTLGIAGAGIGGLALAIALKRKGYAPTVFERRQRDQVGAEGIFLTLAPNGFNALRGLGLADAVGAKGVVTTGIALHNEHGKQIGLVDYAAHAQSFGAPSVTIKRGALGETLLEAALAEGVMCGSAQRSKACTRQRTVSPSPQAARAIGSTLSSRPTDCGRPCGGWRCPTCRSRCSTG
jgi:hypothetical protein